VKILSKFKFVRDITLGLKSRAVVVPLASNLATQIPVNSVLPNVKDGWLVHAPFDAFAPVPVFNAMFPPNVSSVPLLKNTSIVFSTFVCQFDVGILYYWLRRNFRH
jgi:hypothetical protein